MEYLKAKDEFKKINIDLSEEQYNKFRIYQDTLLEWNKKMNLTSITQDEEVWIKHFIDSCTIAKFINIGESIIDVGTGAGFPSIPVKITNDSTKVTLLDSLNKRINFLKELCEKLALNGLNFVHGRAEDFAIKNEHREKYDVACARAVANLSTLVEYCLPFVKVGGRFICMKSGKVDKELEDAKKAIEILGGKINSIEKFTLPDGESERSIILVEKIKKTPNAYPRKAGIPSKNPIM